MDNIDNALAELVQAIAALKAAEETKAGRDKMDGPEVGDLVDDIALVTELTERVKAYT